MPEMDIETINFLREREEKLGGKIIYRTYSLFWGSTDGAYREYGVFLYSDGHRFILEDFDRPPMVLGIEIKRKSGYVYEKLEREFTKDDIEKIDTVTRNSGIEAVQDGTGAKHASSFDKTFRKTLTEVTLKNGMRHYFELMDEKGFRKLVGK